MGIESSPVSDDKGVGRGFDTGGGYDVAISNFETFMEDQVVRIKAFRRELEQEWEREVGLEEAARTWIQRHAEEFRELYEERSSLP